VVVVFYLRTRPRQVSIGCPTAETGSGVEIVEAHAKLSVRKTG